jgi:4-amino-4-deoxy-L-arabinose transferase-like glycosyltransferase
MPRLPALRVLADPYLLAALAIGFLLRLAWLLYIDVEPFSDAEIHFGLAERLADGFGYTLDGEQPSAFYPVGYPATLAAFFEVFGSNDFAVELLNMLAALVTIAATYLLALKVFGPRIARVSAVLVALLPSHILTGSLAFNEPLFTAAFMVACLLIVIALEQVTRPQGPVAELTTSATLSATAFFILPELDTARAFALVLLAAACAAFALLLRSGRRAAALWAAAGVVTGYSLLIKPAAIWLVVAGLVCLFVALRQTSRRGDSELWRRIIWPAGAFCAGVVLLTLPWMVRNWDQIGVGANLSTNGGINVLVGNHEGATGCFHWDPQRFDYLWAYGEVERDRKALEEAADFVVHNPAEALALFPRRFDCTWDSDSAGAYWNQVSAPDPPSDTIYSLLDITSNWYYYGLILLAFIGLPAWFSTRPERLLLVLVVAFTAVYYSFILGDQRYHQPLLPIIAIWAAVGITIIPRWLRLARGGSEYSNTDPSLG